MLSRGMLLLDELCCDEASSDGDGMALGVFSPRAKLPFRLLDQGMAGMLGMLGMLGICGDMLLGRGGIGRRMVAGTVPSAM